MSHERDNKLDFIKSKNFSTLLKINVNRMRARDTDPEKTLAKHIPDKELLSKIYKEHLKIQQ